MLPLLHRAVLAWLSACALCFAQEAPQASPLTTAREIRELPVEEAAQRRLVRLSGVVTFVDPGRTIFLQDDTGATFVTLRRPTPGGVRAGTVIRVTGVTNPGLYVPGIEFSELEAIGEAPIPPPVPVTFEQLASGEFNYQRVSISAIVRAVTTRADRAVLILAAGGGRFEAHLPIEELEQARPLIDSSVTVSALAAGFINGRRQLIAPHLRLRGIEEIRVIDPAKPADELQETPVDQLLRFSPRGRAGHRVKIRGTVTHARGNSLFVRSAEQGLLVRVTEAASAKPGDEVEALGFPEMGQFSALLSDSEYRIVGSATTPEPRPVTVKAALNGAHDADLILIEGRLLKVVSGAEGSTLAMQAGDTLFHARLPDGAGAENGDLQPGALLRLAGVCSVAQTESPQQGFRTAPVAFELLVRGAPDIEVLQAAPWWTPRRLSALVGGLVAATLLTLGWVLLLRRQVARQTRTIRERLHAEAIAEERRRIAREFHDTLEQELVGLSLRLDALAARVVEGKPIELQDADRRLVQRLQAEARGFVWDLREDTAASGSLREAILLATASVRAEGVEVSLEEEGAPPAISPRLQHHLARITQEAVTNAVKHGRATAVRIDASYGQRGIALKVSDNGSGLPPTSAPEGKPGHFGLLGMRERVQRMGGELRLRNGSGGGAVIEVHVPCDCSGDGERF